MSETRTQGKVKWFDARKGYGFITTDAGEDVFVHFSAITMEGFKRLNEAQVVTFEIKQDEKGRTVAADVQPA